MATLIWSGTFISLIGLAGLIICIIKVFDVKKSASNEYEIRAVIKNTLPINLGSLFLSVLGLMGVVVGILLG